MRNLSVIIVSMFVIGCGIWGTLARETLEFVLCKSIMSEQPVEQLNGMTAAEFCAIAKNVAPFLPIANEARASAQKAGLARGTP
jgi:hypothetical protein